MIDEDRNILITIYNYLKLVKPEAEITLASQNNVKYIFIDGPSLEFMAIHCNHKEMVVQVTDKMRVPSWFKTLFHLQRVTPSVASHIIPMHKLGVCYRYFIIEVKDKDLLK